MALATSLHFGISQTGDNVHGRALQQANGADNPTSPLREVEVQQANGVPGNPLASSAAGSLPPNPSGLGYHASTPEDPRFEAIREAATERMEELDIVVGESGNQFDRETSELLCKAAENPNYCIYTVDEGDTLSHVAVRFGLNEGTLPGWELLAASNEPALLNSEDVIRPEQEILVPRHVGVVRPVHRGETIGTLAKEFDVDPETIVEANSLEDGDLIVTGDVLFIPDPKQLPSAEDLYEQAEEQADEDGANENLNEEEAGSTEEASEESVGQIVDQGEATDPLGGPIVTEEPVQAAPLVEPTATEPPPTTTPEPTAVPPTATPAPPTATPAPPTATPEPPTATPVPPTATPAPPQAQPSSSNGFIWPITAERRITNYFSPRHPLGIDLGLWQAPNSSILAVADGVVEFAGGQTCCSYGLYVIVDHGNGLKTLYAHLSRLDVQKGQRVTQGQSLGPAGSTGYSTGVHLHFEVHSNGTRVDPMRYLP